MIKTWISSYLPTQETFKNLCCVAVDQRIRAFVYVTSKRSYAIDFSSLILSLYAVKNGNRRKNLPGNGLPCSWRTQWCKLQLCTALCLEVTAIFVSACNLFSQYLLYKATFLLLLLCRL